MKELLSMMARALVDNPDEVLVTEQEEDDAIVLLLSVAPDDKGRVIGKQGKIASALRAVMKAATAQNSKKVVVKIV